jgi:hypothetical protein
MAALSQGICHLNLSRKGILHRGLSIHLASAPRPKNGIRIEVNAVKSDETYAARRTDVCSASTPCLQSSKSVCSAGKRVGATAIPSQPTTWLPAAHERRRRDVALDKPAQRRPPVGA